MHFGKALDSCYVAAYRLFEGQPKADVIATYLLMLTLSGYVIDLVVAINMMSLLPLYGLNGRMLLLIGCLFCGIVGFGFLSRSPQLTNDRSLGSPQYLCFQRIFFYAPFIVFVILILVGLTAGIRLWPISR